MLTKDDVHDKLDELITLHPNEWISFGVDVAQNNEENILVNKLYDYLSMYNSDASIEDDGSGFMFTILDSDTSDTFEIKRAYDGGKLEIDK